MRISNLSGLLLSLTPCFSGVLRGNWAIVNRFNGLQGSPQHGLQRELRPSRRHRCLLPLPAARDERGEGLSIVAHPAASLVCPGLDWLCPPPADTQTACKRPLKRLRIIPWFLTTPLKQGVNKTAS